MSDTYIKGTIIPIGGNEDKGTHRDESTQLNFVQKSILARVIRECDNPEPLIVVIPTASSIPVEVGEKYQAAFGQFAAVRVHILDIRERSQAEDPEYLRWIAQADCVMFSGGNQSKITRIIRDTPMHSLLTQRFQEEEFVIAGTSAGAMSMSRAMITGGKSTEALFKGAVKTGRGMAYIPDLIIDSHFIQRGTLRASDGGCSSLPSAAGSRTRRRYRARDQKWHRLRSDRLGYGCRRRPQPVEAQQRTRVRAGHSHVAL